MKYQININTSNDMKNSYSRFFCSPFIVTMLLFVLSNNLLSQTNQSQLIIENCRIKLIGETINFINSGTDTLNVSRITVKDITENKTFKKYSELFNALSNNTEYKGRQVPFIRKNGDLIDIENSFFEIIKADFSNKSKEFDEKRLNEFKKKCQRHINQSNGELKVTLENSKKIDEENKLKEAVSKKQTTLSDETQKIQEKIDNQNGKIELSLMLSILCIFISVVIIGLFFLNRKNQKGDLEGINTSIIKIKGELNEIKLKLEEQSNSISETKSMAENTVSDLTDLSIKIDKILILQKEIDNLNLKTSLSPDQSINLTPAPIILYTDYPDNPAGFEISNIKEYRTENSIYEITLENENSATFIFKASPERTKYALNNAQIVLSSACDFENSPNDGDFISTVKCGQLRKETAMWKIIEKAIIKSHT